MVKNKRMMRHASIDENINLEQFLKISNYEDTVRQLDIYYGIVKRQLLRHQSPITGLFPVFSTDTEVGSVRDSVYCAAAVWGLYQAYRRIDDDRGKSYELGQAAVKCMRGILECWVRQADRVERFKKHQCNANALHVKFHLTTGDEVFTDQEYNHLQIDVVSVYLLFLVQMISSGLQIIYTQDTEVGSVRDSVYCAAAVWGLYQAYRRIDDDRGKSYELGQAAVKCMRGILECWVRQADRVERFKKHQCNANALHVKFHLTTGDEVFTDQEYNHLQIDVVSVYLLFLVQMISSGLQIIYTQDEVAFIQNLVYYVERAYRTPDYGMWERGSKYNDGSAEIHASSIGAAKSALEAINGCNLFGESGASWSVIYVDIDAHNRNRSIFETLLPRESSSKGVDAALLPTISFPCFASHEEVLYSETKGNVVRKLRGNYGFKRYGRDGFGCAIEDTNRRYYRTGEIKEFENIESEFPLFYIFMIIDGVFKSLPDQVKEYQELLKARMQIDSHGDPVIPMYYWVEGTNVETERQEPHSAPRRAAPEHGLHLWNQAMFVLEQLLTGGLLHINELDPIRRYLPSYNRPRKGGRYSAFQGTATDLVVQIVLIAESMRLQAMMATYGIQTQTPHEVEPVQIWSSTQLVRVYEQLGVNGKLGLAGRPSRPIGSLGTSKIYRVCGMTVLCYPLVFEVSDFYLYRDMALLIDDIKTELQFVGRYWRLSGRPTVCLLIREEHMRDPQFKEMLDLLAMLKKGYCDGMKVRIGRLQNLISSSCVEHLDFMSGGLPDTVQVESFRQLEHDYIGYQSLTDVPRAAHYRPEQHDWASEFQNQPTPEILERIKALDSVYARCQLYGVLLRREGPEWCPNNDGDTVIKYLQRLYHQAGGLRYWAAVRYASSLLKHTVDSISPFITAVLVHGKQLTVGVVGHQETVFDKPMTPAEIRHVMYSTVQPYDIIQAVLQQEVVLYCGRLIGTNAELFRGILKIRVGWVLRAMSLCLRMGGSERSLESHSPYEVRQLLHRVLSIRNWSNSEQITPLQRRQLEGCLCRVPPAFYGRVWDVMCRTQHGISAHGRQLPQQPTLSVMTRSEIRFALMVEQMLNDISVPEYRQVVVELLCIVSTILRRNPELTFNQPLDLDALVKSAAHVRAKDAAASGGGREGDELHALLAAPRTAATGCLARAVVNDVLRGGQLTSYATEHEDHDQCQIS